MPEKKVALGEPWEYANAGLVKVDGDYFFPLRAIQGEMIIPLPECVSLNWSCKNKTAPRTKSGRREIKSELVLDSKMGTNFERRPYKEIVKGFEKLVPNMTLFLRPELPQNYVPSGSKKSSRRKKKSVVVRKKQITKPLVFETGAVWRI